MNNNINLFTLQFLQRWLFFNVTPYAIVINPLQSLLFFNKKILKYISIFQSGSCGDIVSILFYAVWCTEWPQWQDALQILILVLIKLNMELDICWCLDYDMSKASDSKFWILSGMFNKSQYVNVSVLQSKMVLIPCWYRADALLRNTKTSQKLENSRSPWIHSWYVLKLYTSHNMITRESS